MDRAEATREFKCENGKIYLAHPKSCLFCDNCTDMLYDYTHGPYLFHCEHGLDTHEGIQGNCTSFIENGEVPN